MKAIRIHTKIESETLHLPELKALIGRNVEIIVLEESGSASWLDGADPSVSLGAVRQALAKTATTMAEAVDAERAER